MKEKKITFDVKRTSKADRSGLPESGGYHISKNIIYNLDVHRWTSGEEHINSSGQQEEYGEMDPTFVGLSIEPADSLQRQMMMWHPDNFGLSHRSQTSYLHVKYKGGPSTDRVFSCFNSRGSLRCWSVIMLSNRYMQVILCPS